MRRMCEAQIVTTNRPVTPILVLTFLPSQSRRKLSLSGGSAAKVSEAPLTKNQIKNSKSGASSLPPTWQAQFSGIRGCRGRLSLVTFFGETKKVTCRRQPRPTVSSPTQSSATPSQPAPKRLERQVLATFSNTQTVPRITRLTLAVRPG